LLLQVDLGIAVLQIGIHAALTGVLVVRCSTAQKVIRVFEDSLCPFAVIVMFSLKIEWDFAFEGFGIGVFGCGALRC
jgi:hypothetical protein